MSSQLPEVHPQIPADMAKFNLFRLSCMLDDTDGTKFNKVLVSIICDYIYQRDNERTPLDDCYRYITGEIGISTTKDHLKNIIANVAQFDNDVRTERSVGGMKEAVREGRYVWPAPIGYKNIRSNGKATRPGRPGHCPYQHSRECGGVRLLQEVSHCPPTQTTATGITKR